MRSPLLAGLMLSLLTAPVWAANEGPAGPATTPPPPANQPATPAATDPSAASMPLADACESIIDEDEATRKKAFARLDAATAADLPVLEKYENAADPEIRKQVGLILQRLRRGEAALVLKFPDGTPAAGVKVTVHLFEVIPPEKTDEKKQAAQAAGNANGQGQVQVVINGNVGVGQMVVVGNGVQIIGGQAQATTKEVFNGELTSDAAGKVVIGRYNDGKFQYSVNTSDPLPSMMLGGEIDLNKESPPAAVEVRHGVAVAATVVDADGKPLPGAMVMNINAGQVKMVQMQPPAHTLMWRRAYPNADSDEKGVATLDKMNIAELNLVAYLKGYDLLVTEPQSVKDGDNIKVTLKLAKAVPVEMILAAQGPDHKSLSACRVILVASDNVNTVLGPRWFQDADAKKIDSYVEKGAIDGGTTNDKGEFTVKLLRDSYTLIAFDADGHALRAGLNAAGKGTETQTLSFQRVTPMKMAAPHGQ